MRFRDRGHAGTVLAEAILGEAFRRGWDFAGADVPDTDGPDADGAVVLGVPRGGVVVAAAVANRLRLPLDVALARKIGAPGRPELALGAIAEGGDVWLSEDLISRLGVDRRWIDAAVEAEAVELARRVHRYRRGRPAVAITGRTAIVVDDGVATGATLAAVLGALRSQRPSRLIAAVPVAPPEGVTALAARCDLVVCPLQPPRFDAVGAWYDDFTQTTDDEVTALLGA